MRAVVAMHQGFVLGVWLLVGPTEEDTVENVKRECERLALSQVPGEEVELGWEWSEDTPGKTWMADDGAAIVEITEVMNA